MSNEQTVSVQQKRTVTQIISDNYKKIVVSVGVAISTNPVFAATYDVTEVVSDLEAGEAPVAIVAAATVGVLVVRRVWKLIKGSI